MPKHPMSSVDAAWLRMDDPTNLMMINGFFHFARPLDFNRLRETVRRRLLRFPRFTQRVVESALPLRGPYWETDPHFNLDAHILRVALPEPGDDAVLVEMINQLCSMPLDRNKPLWQFHLIENYGEGCVLFARLHHAIADGIALMHVLLSLCDERADASWSEPADERTARSNRPPLAGLFRPAVGAVSATRKLAGSMLQEGADMLRHPTRALKRGKEATEIAQTLSRLTLLPPDPKTPFKGPLGVRKHTAWTAEIPLPEVKYIGGVLGATINDVLMTLVSGALGKYLVGREVDVSGMNIRAMVPVNLRPLEEAHKLGNRFGLVIMALPMGVPDPMERLVVVKKRMDALKNSPEALVAYSILGAMGLAPSEIETLGVEFFASKATLVLTNVPGPRQKLYFAGERIEKLMFWVPQAGRLGMGVSIISYAGEVLIGVMTDADLVPDPETIAGLIEAEFEQMLEEARAVEASAYKGPVPITDEEARGRCKAIPGSAYCHIHAKVVADSEDMALR
ncbi:MAG: wax ester/triacylglycerol synthase family O-acyltransferase [Chloroflexi bacterium]|nr:wax ester/triacylglycerol synthase family O-acyltransferase [Chloroflexota bacterium]